MCPDHAAQTDDVDRSTAEELTLSRRSLVAAAGAGIGGAALGGVGTAGAVGGSTPPLETDGRWIVDPDGEPVKLRGFATASLDFIDYDWYPFTVEELLERATDGEDWVPNTVRLPITEDPVHEQGMDYVVNDLLRPAVDLLADRGVYAVIDFHLIRPYVDAMGNAEGMVEDGWADTIDDLGFNAEVETDDLLLEFWSEVAPEFADDDNVLYELFNEPTLPVTWADYGEYGDDVQSQEDAWLEWREAAQPWVDEVREHAPETPVIVGSPHWTSRTNFAPQYPFEGENLIYASHIYPTSGLPHEERELPDDPTETVGPFDPQYGEPAEEVPVVCTEFGWDPDEPVDSEAYGSTSEWGEPMREWLESYDNMGWLAWCFDDSWAPTFFDSSDGGDDPWELKDGPEQAGGYVQTWLQETVGDDDEEDHPCESVDAADGTTLEDGSTVCDVDGDGSYRDVNGDGSVSNGDVTDFFSNQHVDPWDSRTDLFDFDGNDDVGQGDVVALFEHVN